MEENPLPPSFGLNSASKRGFGAMKTRGQNLVQLHRDREIKQDYGPSFPNDMHVTSKFIGRLGLEKELDGHNGCVNCLEWNETGTILASGSDDVQVILWDPFRYKKLHAIQTGHHGNIFSVKFLPKSSDNTVVSGAADFRIRVHDVPMGETTHVCSCHTGRVKRLATAPNLPYMFWSAAEDGTIMQFDLRAPHTCSSEVGNVLVNLMTHLGRYAEAKCVAINALRPELMAVGANDPYVRLYDRRMIRPTCLRYPAPAPDAHHHSHAHSHPHSPSSPSSWEPRSFSSSILGIPDDTTDALPAHVVADAGDDNLPPGCVTYFVAGHLPMKHQDFRKRYRALASTYLTFGPDGNELLVNLGGEQIYLFDINKKRLPKTFDMQFLHMDSTPLPTTKPCNPMNGYTNGLHVGSNGLANGVTSVAAAVQVAASSVAATPSTKKPPLPPRAEALKLQANLAFEKQQYTLAISLYNQAMSICPNAPVLYGNRAAALMKRAWDGDTYAALRDCHTALQLDPNHLKAHFRLARCLYELQWTREARECLQAFKTKFPDHAKSSACKALDKDIQLANVSHAESEADSEDKDSLGASKSPSSKSGGGAAGAGTSTSEGSSLPSPSEPPSQRRPPLSALETQWRQQACDYSRRFCGHCNTTTDIKEASFFGSRGQYVVAGSDDGSFFVWDARSTNIVRVLRGDDSIVNCLQPHPTSCLLATSGIDVVVRLWSPRPEDGSKNDREVQDLDDAASANQKRMNADPFEVMLMNMGYRITGVPGGGGGGGEMGGGGEDSGDDAPREAASVQCRPS